MDIKICVCGAGTMGSGIALAVAQAGMQVIVYEKEPSFLLKAKDDTHNILNSLESKGKISEGAKAATLANMTFTSVINDCIADICIEAITEKLGPKIGLLKQLAAINGAHTILATNTSSLPVSEIAAAIPGPERVAGLHFFNPATLMKLVEVVRSEFSSPEVISSLQEFVKRLGKTAVVCKDSPGFIVNRVARPFYIETLRLLEEEATDIEQADRLMESAGFRMGPFRLMDLIGNDINYAVSCSVYEQLRQPERLRPSSIQHKLVENKQLGRKSGAGYYQYSSDPQSTNSK